LQACYLLPHLSRFLFFGLLKECCSAIPVSLYYYY
jgi:hypothetical protein